MVRSVKHKLKSKQLKRQSKQLDFITKGDLYLV